MKTIKVTALIISAVFFAVNTHAEEQFRMPDECAKACVGFWNVIMMGKGEDLKPFPKEKTLAFDFRADGTGIQYKGEREIAIIWGASNEGKFAIQWKQENGKGDAAMGTWEVVDKGMNLTIREFEDGVDPEAGFGVLILSRKKDS